MFFLATAPNCEDEVDGRGPKWKDGGQKISIALNVHSLDSTLQLKNYTISLECKCVDDGRIR